MNEEEWRDIPGHANYQASRDGRIRNKTKGNILVPKRSPGSHKLYWKVDLGWSSDKTLNKKKRNQYIHRLVALTFHGDTGEQVDHKDRDTSNNAPDNLEPVSMEENLARRVMARNPTAEEMGQECLEGFGDAYEGTI